MDIVKLFTDDRLGLESLSDDSDGDARRRLRPPHGLESDVAEGLAAFLSDARAAQYARVYLAGSTVGEADADGVRLAIRTGLTALGDAEAFVQPLLAWGGGRPWHALRGETLVGLTAPEAGAELRRGDATLAVGALGLESGASPGDAGLGADLSRLSDDRRATLAPLRRALDAGLAVLLPEPAPDGRDWTVYARAPLSGALTQAFRDTPSAARCFAAPYQKMRGEHKFYFERWALDAPPPAVTEL